MASAVTITPVISVTPAPVPTPVKKTVTRRKAAPKAAATPVPSAVVQDAAAPPAPVVVETPLPAAVEPPVVASSSLVGNDEEIDLTEDITEENAVVEGATLGETSVTQKKKTVKGANKERLFQEFEKLYENLEKILTEQNLKGVLKDTKSVRDMTYRLLKLKTVERQKRDTNNSGFMKPVRISAQLEAFLQKNGLYQPELTRAYLTTVLCSYIKTKELQNPADRRIIFPDADLKDLFGITETTNTEPLTYYTLQKRIQTHIHKN